MQSPLGQHPQGDARPSTSSFLQQARLDPVKTSYQVDHDTVSQLYRALWNSIFNHVSPAHFLPREVAPTVIHAIVFLERCDWKLCEAQKRAVLELNERRRERLGEIQSSSSSSSSSSLSTANAAVAASSSSSQHSRDMKVKFTTPRHATPPPGASAADQLGPEYGEERKGVPCGHVFRKGEAIYRCRDCALDETCVLCAPCFNASNHDGHDIVFSVSSSSGGCCDCGDEEAWTSRIGCRYHDRVEDGEAGSTDMASTSTRQEECVNLDMQSESTTDMEDGTSHKGKEPERKTDLSGDHIKQIDRLLANVPIEVQGGLISSLDWMLSFVLDTMEHAPMEMKLPEGPEVIETIKRQASLEVTDEDPGVEMRMTGSYSFGTSEKNRLYSVVLWNDEKHSFREVIDTVSGATEKTEHTAKGIAERVDRHGRDIIETSSEVKKLYLLAHKLSQIDLAVTVRPAFDIYAEEIAGHVLDFLLDLTNSALFVALPSPASTNPLSTHPLDQFVPNAAAMRALVGRTLFEPWRHRKIIPQGDMSTDFFDNRSLCQLDGLLLLDNRMWKSARITCRSIYLALIGPREVKRALAYRFAKMYPKLVEIFIIQDREPDHSIRALTVQLFSVPSIATELVADLDLLFTIKEILQSIFTGQLTIESLTLPPKWPEKMRATPASLLPRQARCYHIFSDMRYMLSAQGVQSQLVSQPRHLSYFLDFLKLFNAITPDKRAVTEHIEFESELWIQIFHIATHLSRLAKFFGEAFVKADRYELVRGLIMIFGATGACCSSLHMMDQDAHAPITFKSFAFAGATHDVIDFAVETSGVSFHHPMQWLLAETLKHLHKVEYTAPPQKCRPLGRGLLMEGGDNEILIVFEFSLRVVVKLAQIRAGMWVRNGFGLRSQAHHYRDNSMRDSMYDQDFFLLQCSFTFVSVDQMLVNMVHRFSLLEWLQGLKSANSLDSQHYVNLTEEFLLLLVHLLSETSIAMAWSMEEQVQREIIHFLALSQGTYSELTRHISDRLKDHSSFDRVLASVSSFRAPDGTTDLGIFELKDKYYDEVQPYFFHFTRNQREEAEQVLREREKRKNGAQAAEEFVAVPKKSLYEGRVMIVDELRNVLRSSVLRYVIFSALYNSHFRLTSPPDSVVDGAIQVIMIGLVELEGEFAYDMSKTIAYDYSLLTLVISMLRNQEKFASFRAKTKWIAQRASELSEACRLQASEVDRTLGTQGSGLTDEQSIADKKRMAAKARQAAIMQQFSAQQKSLLESLEGEEDDDDVDARDDDGDAAMDTAEDSDREPAPRSFGTCIFCQENLDQHKSFGSLAHIQGSRLIRTTPRHDVYSLQQSLQTSLTLDRNESSGKRLRGDSTPAYSASNRQWNGFPTEDHRFGFYASACGHLMHVSCFGNYCCSVEQRHAQQIARNHPEDLARSEFVCPLCKSLGNVMLPVPKTSLQPSTDPSADPMPISDWIRKINIDILKTSTVLQMTQLQESENGTGSFLPWYAEDAEDLLDASNDETHRGHSSSNAQAVPAPTRQMLQNLIRVLRPMSTKSRSMRQAYQTRTIHAPPGRKMYIPEEVVAYTISVLEVAQRGTTPVRKDEQLIRPSSGAVTVADAVNVQTRELVQSLILSLRDIAKLENGNYQSLMRHGLLMRLLPHWGGHEPVRSPLLLRDPLTILIETSIIAPENLQQVTVLMFYVQLVQVVFGLAQPSIWPQNSHAHLTKGGAGASLSASWKGKGSSSSSSSSNASSPITAASIPRVDNSDTISKSDSDVLKGCFEDVRATVGNIIGLVGYARGNITLGVDNLDDQSLAKIICTYCLPFLRRATILQRCMGVLREGEGQEDHRMMGDVEKGEFLRLMTILEIPLPREALPVHATRQTALAGLVEGWIKHAYPQLAQIFRPLPIQPSPLSVSSTKGGALHHPTLQLEHPHIYELIHLPTDLTKLLMQCQMLRCKTCGNLPPEPAICLECGELLCFQSFCCQGQVDSKGECNRHVDECGHSSGLFFKIKSNIIILLFQGNGCFTFSPYLDAHGEIDIGLKKGKIQFLHMARFDELRKQWLNHGLANIITRKIEAVIDQGGWITM